MPWWVAASCAAAAFLSLIPLKARFSAEMSNKALGLAVEGQTVSALAAKSGASEEDILSKLAPLGVNGLVASEETAAELISQGRITVKSSTSHSLTLEVKDPGLKKRLTDALRLRYPAAKPSFSPSSQSDDAGAATVSLAIPPSEAPSVSLGIDPELAAAARKNGMEIIARHSNVSGADESYVTGMLKSSRDLGAKWFLPSGDQMLGRRAVEKKVGEILTGLQMVYVTPEFVKLAGDDKVRNAIPTATVRLHSIQAAESDKMAPPAVVERYAKAFRERGIRWLLLRPISLGEMDPLATFSELIKDVRTASEREGAVIRVPKPFSDPSVPSPLYSLIYLCALPAIFWTAQKLLKNPKAAMWATGFAGLFFAASLMESVRPYSALLVAIGFPTAAYLWLEEQEKPQPLFAFALMSLFSLAAGLVIAGSFIGAGWMIQNDQFTGIKAAHFVPIGLAGIIMLRARTDIKQALKEPILWGTALLGVVVLAAVAFMLARTGNDNPAGVSSMELKFRSILDAVLYTRPRTKEFLIGHPALIIGLAMLGWKSPKLRSVGALLCVIGAIGLTSMVNTLCHFHTPVELSLARIGIGWVIGGILGLLGAAILGMFRLDRAASLD